MNPKMAQFKDVDEVLSNFDKIDIKNKNDVLVERVVELEIKVARIYDLLIDKTNVKKEERLTKFGKRFQKRFY